MITAFVALLHVLRPDLDTHVHTTSPCTRLYRVPVFGDTLKRRMYVAIKGDLRHAYPPIKVVRLIVFNTRMTNKQMHTR